MIMLWLAYILLSLEGLIISLMIIKIFKENQRKVINQIKQYQRKEGHIFCKTRDDDFNCLKIEENIMKKEDFNIDEINLLIEAVNIMISRGGSYSLMKDYINLYEKLKDDL